VKNISKTGAGINLYNNETIYLFSPDKFSNNKLKNYLSDKRKHCIYCDITDDTQSCKCDNILPKSADGLYVKFVDGYYPELYFIEFKNFNIYEQNITSGGDLSDYDNYQDDVDLFVKPSYNNIKNTLKELLKNGKKAHRRKFRLEVNLKATETLLCVLPHVYLYYCHKNRILGENTKLVNDFSSFLANCKKEYILAYDNQGNNISQYHAIIRDEIKCENNPYYLQRIRSIPFENIHFFGLEEEFVSYIQNL